jgi:hypothetical protein
MADEASPGGRGDHVVPRGKLRASDDDRNRVVELLRVSAGDGRITADELGQRVAAALTARTYDELAALISDLPAGPVYAPGVTAPAPKDVMHIHRRSGRLRRDGRWAVPRRIGVRITSGHVTLDFTRAIVVHPTLMIDVEMRDGQLTLVTRPGIAVDVYEIDVRYSRVKIREPPSPDGAVLLRIIVAGHAGQGRITVRPPYRAFWPRLRLRPSRDLPGRT